MGHQKSEAFKKREKIYREKGLLKTTNSERVKAWRKRHPLKYQYSYFISNNRNLGNEINLSFEEFVEHITQTF